MKNLEKNMGRIRCVQKCVQKHEFVCKNKNETVGIPTVSWRRGRDSSPTGNGCDFLLLVWRKGPDRAFLCRNLRFLIVN